MPEAKTKTINGVAFEISQPYEEGHTLSAIEARVLNQTRSENIGNNARAKLKELQAAGESEDAMRAYVSSVDAEYEFTAAAARAGAKLDPYEREARKQARELLKSHLAETGRKVTTPPEGVSQEEWDEKIEAETDRIAALPDVVKEAKKIVDARSKRADAMKGALEGVSL